MRWSKCWFLCFDFFSTQFSFVQYDFWKIFKQVIDSFSNLIKCNLVEMEIFWKKCKIDLFHFILGLAIVTELVTLATCGLLARFFNSVCKPNIAFPRGMMPHFLCKTLQYFGNIMVLKSCRSVWPASWKPIRVCSYCC